MWLSVTNAAAVSMPPRTERVALTERTEHPAAPWHATRRALAGAEPGAAAVGAHTRECCRPNAELQENLLREEEIRVSLTLRKASL